MFEGLKQIPGNVKNFVRDEITRANDNCVTNKFLEIHGKVWSKLESEDLKGKTAEIANKVFLAVINIFVGVGALFASGGMLVKNGAVGVKNKVVDFKNRVWTKKPVEETDKSKRRTSISKAMHVVQKKLSKTQDATQPSV
jgi:hypothetical protein